MKIFAVGLNYPDSEELMEFESQNLPRGIERRIFNHIGHNKGLDDSLLKREKTAEKEALETPGQVQPDWGAHRMPIIYTKADSALLSGGKPFFIPSFTEQCEYETEVVVRICRLGRSIAQRWAHRYYDQVTVGIDFTARDLQRRLRAEGLSWELSKGFDGSAVIGNMVKLETLPNVQDLHFRLDKNGETVQQGYTGEMLFKVDEIVSYISQFFTLKMGDLIYTGTPAGVGVVHEDDHLEGYLEGTKVLDFNVK